MKRDKAPFGAWLARLGARAPKNVVVVAMANKLARIAWAVLSSGNDYRSTVPAYPARKGASGSEALRAPTFPHHDDEFTSFPHRSLHRATRTKEQSQRRVRSLLSTMIGQRPSDLSGPRRAHLILARRTSLHPKAEYICADLSSRPNFPLQSRGGSYIVGT